MTVAMFLYCSETWLKVKPEVVSIQAADMIILGSVTVRLIGVGTGPVLYSGSSASEVSSFSLRHKPG